MIPLRCQLDFCQIWENDSLLAPSCSNCHLGRCDFGSINLNQAYDGVSAHLSWMNFLWFASVSRESFWWLAPIIFAQNFIQCLLRKWTSHSEIDCSLKSLNVCRKCSLTLEPSTMTYAWLIHEQHQSVAYCFSNRPTVRVLLLRYRGGGGPTYHLFVILNEFPVYCVSFLF